MRVQGTNTECITETISTAADSGVLVVFCELSILEPTNSMPAMAPIFKPSAAP